MPLEADLRIRLLESIEADRLVLVCGAGLSMAPPSSLPDAKTIANACFDAYQELGGRCDGGLRDELAAFAQQFVDDGLLRPYFVSKLVPWERFVRPPNEGHTAVADLLLCRAVAAALTTNYDTLWS